MDFFNINGFELRIAEEKDIAQILEFIKELAEYEKMSDLVTANEEILLDSLLIKKAAEVIIVEENSKPVGFALFFNNFSTFLGIPGIYIEDLYIKSQYRGKGIGTSVLSFLANLTIERGYGRLEWSCLDWNESSIKFYKALGAEPMEEWTTYRVFRDKLTELAKYKNK